MTARKGNAAQPMETNDQADVRASNAGARDDAAAFIETSGNAAPIVPSSGLYGLLVESVRDYAIFALDTTGHILSWNRGAQRLKGYTASEIIGRHFSIFYPAEDVARGKTTWELEVAAREGRSQRALSAPRRERPRLRHLRAGPGRLHPDLECGRRTAQGLRA